MTNTSVIPPSTALDPVIACRMMDQSVPVLIPEGPVSPATVNGHHDNNNTNNNTHNRSPKTSHFRRGHIRSISHPFPSPFSWRSKKRNKVDHDFLDSDDDDDDDFGVGPAHGRRNSGSPRKENAGVEDDLSGGKCMACGYVMRWPRSCRSFRCTACLTVNDIEPFYESNDNYHSPNGWRHQMPVVHRRAFPVSVERTKALIDACVSRHLSGVLDEFPVPTGEGSPDTDTNHLSPDSAMTPPGRVAMLNEENVSPTPSPSSYVEGKSIPMRNRSHSDLPSLSNGEQSRRGAGQSRFNPENRGIYPYVFKELEDYLRFSFKDCDSLNNSFVLAYPHSRRISEDHIPPMKMEQSPPAPRTSRPIPINEHDQNDSTRPSGHAHAHPRGKSFSPPRSLSSKGPCINWVEVGHWYHLVMNAGMSWFEKWKAMKPAEVSDPESAKYKKWSSFVISKIEKEIIESRMHLRRTLLKATENLLKRPCRPLRHPEHIRFLLILLENPMLYSAKLPVSPRRNERKPSPPMDVARQLTPRASSKSPSRAEPPIPVGAKHTGSGHPSAIIKRILGLLANLPDVCHHYLISWLSRYSAEHFERIVNLVGGFVTHRLMRQQGQQQQPRPTTSPTDADLVPTFASPAANTPARLHAALNGRSPPKSAGEKAGNPIVYGEDWQMRAAARVMSMIFAANSAHASKRPAGYTGRPGNRHGNIIPINTFYNSLLDYSDLVADFDAWESKAAGFSFCQYPFFLSIWAKIRIMEHDARRQMELKAREAFFDSLLHRRAVSQYLVLKVRRECLAEDSLRGVSEVVGTGQEEIKKGLRIEFTGEDGVDAGGLRKEWFLLLVREVFDPNHGLFLYDEESQYCYFNPYCFEFSEKFFLVGVLLGLAIYNSTILDIALPPFAFKKLLAAAPPTNGTKTSIPRTNFKCTLDDLAEYRPSLAKGLRGLLEYDGDVRETFCYDFVASVERYGEVVNVPLCPGGENRPVTNSNRREFVDLYVQYLLDTAVSRQFEPLKRGFFTVCGGNALSLFRPEEIELLIRGSDAPLDVSTLRAVATYDNWPADDPESVPVVGWFWEFFTNADPKTQRKILSFITGSDRIPAMGETNLTIRLVCLGDDTSRYPTAHTCFNTLGLYRYESKEVLERMLSEAIVNGEGFGLK